MSLLAVAGAFFLLSVDVLLCLGLFFFVGILFLFPLPLWLPGFSVAAALLLLDRSLLEVMATFLVEVLVVGLLPSEFFLLSSVFFGGCCGSEYERRL